MAIVGLDRQQGFALLAEMTSTRNLLAYGIRVIRTGAFIDTTRDPILTMLSIGVEKLYKLTLGLIALDLDHKWPTKTEMQKQGHKLVAMHTTVMNELRVRTADKSEYVRGLLAEVDNDTVVLPIIEALDMYGRMGRFYYLDELGDAQQPVSPDDAWQNIEQAALADSTVATLYQQAMSDLGDNDAWDKFIHALHERIATAIERLWAGVAVCGRNHALGETGGVFGFEVHPDSVGRQ
ncbi:hypothetical protein [Yimella lutea]|uniref:hypothetical protein n=1 Tax=Yimella lutea TaxID=587872 RepID=UPI001151A14B|nr:hypothetical protein [Yimella lutea]